MTWTVERVSDDCALVRDGERVVGSVRLDGNLWHIEILHPPTDICGTAIDYDAAVQLVLKIEQGYVPVSASDLYAWTVYRSPKDYPGRYVVRVSIIQRGDVIPTIEVYDGPTLASVREKIPRGLARFPRNDTDDPCIVESWM